MALWIEVLEVGIEATDCAVATTGIAFYTYFVNHPHHNPDRIDVPIGPVYIGVTDPPRSWVVGTRREPWLPAPDSTEPRRKVIVLAEHLSLDPQPKHPSGTSLRLAVIEQLARRDMNALPALRRIIQGRPHRRQS